MKITIFGLTLSSSWGNGHATPYRAILRGLARAGHEVTFYEKDVAYYALCRDFTDPEFCRLVLYRDWKEIQGQALAEAASSDVTVNASYCPEGARIADEVLCLGRPFHVFYDLDTPITLAALASSGVEYLRREQIPCFDLYLSFTGGRILAQLERDWGARRARPLYGCVDPDVYRRVEKRGELECLLSYMGTYSEDRQAKLESLFLSPARSLPQERFLLAGALYPGRSAWPSNICHFDHIAPGDHPAFFSSSRATLNITREGMASSGYCPSGRFFEAAACSCPIISDYFEGLETFFTPGEEIVVADLPGDVLQALSGAVPLSDFARRAKQRTLDEHSGTRRAEEFLRYVEEAAATPLGARAVGEVQA